MAEEIIRNEVEITGGAEFDLGMIGVIEMAEVFYVIYCAARELEKVKYINKETVAG
jgi:hypothetical protein